ncbi:structure-specific endonuclease subunit SLX4 [Parachaetomium inaequale]|uniref:Structure-specific endonuclease subunit SLX4 n=1 Tax=Parachaetomium inaequale TaxID=2588326 RepID=A0AAN6PHC2_9PEZI|nr:structure-specific endonuclease subunit SLX4 [Parachaetomium inaequale]
MAHHDSVVVISSSPDFPSICDLLPKAAKKPPLRSGSNAAPVPDDAPTTFTSAASMWQSSRIQRLEDTGVQDTGPSRGVTSAKPPAIAPSELSRPVEGAGRGSKEQKGKARAAGPTRRKGKADQAKLGDAADEPVSDAPVAVVQPREPARKPRPSKDAAMAQTTLPKGKVTKPAAKQTQSKKKAETVSRHFAPQASAPVAPRELIGDPIDDEPVVLEPAMRRRMDWTPPRESAPVPCLADSSTMKEPSSSVRPAQDDVFKALQGTYGLTAEADVHANTTAGITDVLGKRKLIEMVVGPGNKQTTPEASPTKPKAAKKKPRTITDLATAAYRLAEDEDVSTAEPQQDSLLGYLETSRGEPPVASKGAAKPKASKRITKPKVAKKKEQPPKPILLSPTSAMRQVAKQDFVFGTASQLATEDDPALLRALHEAMKVSNQADGDPFASPSPGNSSLAIRRRPGPGLWAAGARYGDGNLLDMEVLDLTRSSPLPLPKATCAEQEAVPQRPPNEKACIEIEMSDDTLDLSNSPPVGRPKTLLQCAPRPVDQAILLDDPSPTVNNRPQTPPQEPDFEPPPSNQEQHQLLLSQSNSPQQEKSTVPPPPNFELYTDARLAKEVASYGFKVVKKRMAMVALLNQCWESRNKTTLGSRTAQAAMSTSSANQAASPSRPRGQPRTGSVTSVSDAVEPVPAKRGRKKVASASYAETEAPQAEKRPRGRPRKNSVSSISDAAEAPGPVKRGRGKSISVSDVENEAPQVEKRPRGRPKKIAGASPAKRAAKAKAPASPKRAKSPPKLTAPAPATPRRRKAPAKSVLEIPDSDFDDPFASSPASSPDKQADVFSSPPAMDLSVTEDTETSLMASPTTQQVSLFRYITQAVVGAPRTNDPADPSWHEKMLMYDPIILEDLTAWLNAGQLDNVGYDGEVAPGDVKKWCESKSVCCLWRVNLRGKERKRF